MILASSSHNKPSEEDAYLTALQRASRRSYQENGYGVQDATSSSDIVTFIQSGNLVVDSAGVCDFATSVTLWYKKKYSMYLDDRRRLTRPGWYRYHRER